MAGEAQRRFEAEVAAGAKAPKVGGVEEACGRGSARVSCSRAHASGVCAPRALLLLPCAAPAAQVAPKFEALDLESCSGRYNTVTCLDVMIHYPQARGVQGKKTTVGRASCWGARADKAARRAHPPPPHTHTHHTQDKADGMISHLASLSDDRLIISFAPKVRTCACSPRS